MIGVSVSAAAVPPRVSAADVAEEGCAFVLLASFVASFSTCSHTCSFFFVKKERNFQIMLTVKFVFPEDNKPNLRLSSTSCSVCSAPSSMATTPMVQDQVQTLQDAERVYGTKLGSKCSMSYTHEFRQYIIIVRNMTVLSLLAISVTLACNWLRI